MAVLPAGDSGAIGNVAADSPVLLDDTALSNVNNNVVYKFGESTTSWKKGRSNNGFNSIQRNDQLYFNMKTQLDIGNVVINQVPGSSGGTDVAYNLAGAPQIITVANPADFALSANTPFSIMFAAKIKATGGHFYMGRSTATDRSWDVAFNDNNAGYGVTIQLTDASGGLITATSARDKQVNLPINCVITYDGSGTAAGLKVYVNATDETVVANSGTFTAIRSGGTFQIGKFLNFNPQDCDLYYLSFFNKALSPSEVVSAANNGGSLAGTAFYNNVVAAWYFNNNLNDEKGTHNGTATTPLYV